MRLEAARRIETRTAAGPARSSGAGEFSLAGTGGATQPAATSAPARVLGLDNLVLPQSVDEAAERKRANKRGGRLLDLLDAIKLGMLTGSLDAEQVTRLRQAVADGDADYADAGLRELMGAIDLRAQVELAKLERH